MKTKAKKASIDRRKQARIARLIAKVERSRKKQPPPTIVVTPFIVNLLRSVVHCESEAIGDAIRREDWNWALEATMGVYGLLEIIRDSEDS